MNHRLLYAILYAIGMFLYFLFVLVVVSNHKDKSKVPKNSHLYMLCLLWPVSLLITLLYLPGQMIDKIRYGVKK